VRTAFLILAGWFLLTLQTSALHVWPGVPDFLVPFALYFGFTREVLRGAIFAGALGYLADLLGGGPRGLNIFVAMVLSMLGSVLSTRLFLRGPIFATVLTAFGSFLAQLTTVGLLTAFYRDIHRTDLLWSDVLPVSIATTLCGALVFAMCTRIDAIHRKLPDRDAAAEP
jgi:rod shape-determining protein MreD